jgi:hypothetical protein
LVVAEVGQVAVAFLFLATADVVVVAKVKLMVLLV